MTLTITNNNNVYKVKGQLVKFNIRAFQNELKNIFEEADHIILNLRDLINIDSHGINAIAKLHNEALSKKKKLAIIGFGNNELVHHFKTNKVA
ncbi:STAS domain-containing protein [Lacinutrix iliipiscaria]|uniref:STAS domain-containing protein n=1 Tax=Lacinutrix iliipiscaria TaxID=1230532 RepID=A0ABW5WKW4_9FLAO